MITTIQLKGKTIKKLEKLRKKYETMNNKKLSYDEILNLLLDNNNDSFSKKYSAVNYLFGIIPKDKITFIETRREREKRIEINSKRK